MLTAAVWASVLLLGLMVVRASRQYNLSRPPGPPGLPILGNVLDWTSHEMWRRTDDVPLGDMVFVRVFGMSVLFLNSHEAVNELLHKRGALYSDRAHLVLACEMAGFGDIVPLTRYGEKFKLERRLMNQALGFSVLEKWQPFVAKEAHLLLSSLLSEPQSYLAHFKRYAGSLIFTTIYGYHTKLKRDPYIADAEQFMSASSSSMAGGWMVDSFPFLRYVPGLGVHRIAEKWRNQLPVWVDKPYQMFKALPDSTMKQNSFCGNLLMDDHGKISTDPELEHRVKWLATSLYGPGSDTTVVSLTMLLLALVHYPEVLKKAQREIDRVVGTERLPTFSDREQLPYIDCIIKEVLRWGTPVPITPPHRLIQPDQYREYTLDEGIVHNSQSRRRAILHDERLYPEPEKFSPERFELEKDLERLRLMDSFNYAFGFGRRRCPGMHFADQSLFFTFTSIMACFNIAPVTDSNGEPILPPLEFDGGVFRHPKPFKCSITPRRKNVESLIQAAVSVSI
ncbi:cytochrome P450 [Ganoderma sinense ZZ0214-1]|uniref:Cytochrome P450 n=1 Tax=Ganoderma sinense ZZ0214-1 TaxID=1077348 RepID=A0A2G8RTZ0_9APHY|nr:cytochrome P450 [Ganoderma sinense ZZ0214-1]